MGPFNVIGNVSQEQQGAHSMSSTSFSDGQEWAHPLSSAAFLMNNMGPFNDIGNLSLEQQWAQSMTSATLPVHTHELQLAHSLSSAVFLMEIMPIQCHRQLFSCAVIGTSNHIGNISSEK